MPKKEGEEKKGEEETMKEEGEEETMKEEREGKKGEEETMKEEGEGNKEKEGEGEEGPKKGGAQEKKKVWIVRLVTHIEMWIALPFTTCAGGLLR